MEILLKFIFRQLWQRMTEHYAVLLLLGLSCLLTVLAYRQTVEDFWRTARLPVAQDIPQILELADETGQVDWRAAMSKTSDLVQKTIILPPQLDPDAYRRPLLKILMAGSATRYDGAKHSYDLVIRVDGVEVKRYYGGPPEDADWSQVPISEPLLRGKRQIVVTLQVVGKPDAEWNYANVYGAPSTIAVHSSFNGSSADLSPDEGIQTGEYLIRLVLEAKPFGKTGDALPAIPALVLFPLVLYTFARLFWQPCGASLVAGAGFLVALGTRYLLGVPDFVPILMAAALFITWSILIVKRRTDLVLLNRVVISTLLLVLWFGLASRWAKLIDVLGSPLSAEAITYRTLTDKGGSLFEVNLAPLFIWAVKAMFSVLGSSDLALRLTSITLSMVLIVIAFWLGRRIANAYFGLLCAALLAFNHQAIVSSVQGLASELFGAVLLLFLGTILASQDEVNRMHTQRAARDNPQTSMSWSAVVMGSTALATSLVYPYSLVFVLPICIYRLRHGKVAFAPAVVALVVLAIVISSVLLSELQGLAKMPSITRDQGKDEISLYERRFEALKRALPDSGVVGYVTDDGPGSVGAQDYYLTQYALSPLVVDSSAEHPLVVGNFRDNVAALSIYKDKNLTLLEDFGGGVMLFRSESK